MRCKQCGEKISITAKYCKRCGNPVEKQTRKLFAIIFPIIFCFILIAIALGIYVQYGINQYHQIKQLIEAESFNAIQLPNNNYFIDTKHKVLEDFTNKVNEYAITSLQDVTEQRINKFTDFREFYNKISMTYNITDSNVEAYINAVLDLEKYIDYVPMQVFFELDFLGDIEEVTKDITKAMNSLPSEYSISLLKNCEGDLKFIGGEINNYVYDEDRNTNPYLYDIRMAVSSIEYRVYHIYTRSLADPNYLPSTELSDILENLKEIIAISEEAAEQISNAGQDIVALQKIDMGDINPKGSGSLDTSENMEVSTKNNYMNWTLSDWSSASLTEQSSLLMEILSEVDTDASAQDIGATLGLYLGQGKTVGDFINDAKADPSIIKGLDELTTAPSDYMDWTLADWSAASSEDQTATILTVISEIGVDASVQDIGASLGYYLGMGKTIGDFVNDAKADPSVVQSMDDIMADLEEDLSGLTE